MQTAWRERDPQARIKAAHEAIDKNSECATAYILLAEEEATTIIEAEKIFKQALKVAETNYRKSQQYQHQSAFYESQHRRDTNVMIYIKRRLAMCNRKLGKLREATKMMRDLIKEFPMMNVFNIHENLIEALLEMQAYADVQAVLAKYDGKFHIIFIYLIYLMTNHKLMMLFYFRYQLAKISNNLLHSSIVEGKRSE